MTMVERTEHADRMAPQIGWQAVEAARWQLAYDALVGDVVALQAAITETRADLETLRADLATADEIHHQTPLTST